MKNLIKHLLLYPPRWAEKILAKSVRYRAFVIRECMRMLNEEIEARKHLTVTWDPDEEDAYVRRMLMSKKKKIIFNAINVGLTLSLVALMLGLKNYIAAFLWALLFVYHLVNLLEEI